MWSNQVSRHTEVNIWMETDYPFQEPSTHLINAPLVWLVAHSFTQCSAPFIRHPFVWLAHDTHPSKARSSRPRQKRKARKSRSWPRNRPKKRKARGVPKFHESNWNFTDTIYFWRWLNSEIFNLYLIYLKFHEDFTPNLTNVEISEP